LQHFTKSVVDWDIGNAGLLVVLILMLVGSVPAHPYSAGWGYYPSGIIGTVLLVFVILLLLGRV
jgi:hypothetical protein